MTTTPEEIPAYWGASIADVRALLRHVDFGPAAGSSNPHYAQARSHPITDETIGVYLDLVTNAVTARIRRYEEVPERTREHVATMARTLVANGAAYYAQAAAYPASADPNNGSPYVADLRRRYETGLDALAAEVQEEAEKVEEETLAAAGRPSHTFPPALFPDTMRF